VADNLIGKTLGGRYRILERIGEGGMAVVYKANDLNLDRFVAIKFIHLQGSGSNTALARFKQEALALAKLSHPYILSIFDIGELEGRPYLVMEHIPGGTLKDMLKGRPIPWERAAQITASLARALDTAHSKGIIHRDVKPANILMAGGREPKLSDFGIAKLILDDETTNDLTGTGRGIGTFKYMAPEQGKGHADSRSDIYSLGVVFYQMVTGSIPFDADTPLHAMIRKSTESLPNPRQYIRDLPVHIEKILIKALAREPEDRFQTMKKFADALEGKYIETEGGEETKTIGLPIFSQTKKWISGALIVIVFLLCCSGGLFAAYPVVSSFLTPAPTATQTPSPTPRATNTPRFTPTPTPIPEEFTNDAGATMRLVPEGEFIMGGNDGNADERPRHLVYLETFYMDKYEVTNSLYEACVEDGACDPPQDGSSGTRSAYYGNSQYADYPVIHVNWDQAQTYCEWRGARLPTEAEWEKAARGIDEYKYPWGNSFQCRNGNFDDLMRLDGYVIPGGPNCDGYKDTAPVGLFDDGSSPYTIYDMAGNVWEWVADWYDENYYSDSPNKDPQGPPFGSGRVIRGGAWDVANTKNLLATRRIGYDPSTTANYLGFRCADSLP
jgi:serine/threonine-protein kinase